MVRVGRKAIRTSRGKVLHFKSARKMKNWERMAQAIKHGFVPTKTK